MIIHAIEVALVFILILSVLVAAHEFGHYIVARLFGMAVEEFSIGMGGSKPLFTYYKKTYRIPLTQGEEEFVRSYGASSSHESSPEKSSEEGVESPPSHPSNVSPSNVPPSNVPPSNVPPSNVPSAMLKLEAASDDASFMLEETESGTMLKESTVFTVRPLPIGGFVRLKGVLPHDDGSETKIPGGFYSKAPWKRFLVLLAGPLVSVFAGIAVMIPLYMEVGMRKLDPKPVLGTVLQGAASKAGLRSGDRIVSMDGQAISNFYQIITRVQNSAGVRLHIVYERDGKQFKTDLVPVLSDTPTFVLGPDLTPTGEMSRHALMGATPIETFRRASFIEASVSALRIPITTVNSLLGAVKRPSTAKSVVGGPGTMIKATSDAVNSGVVDVIGIAAEISISVGIFNLLPIFPLDGGQMAVALAEILRGGRRLSMKVQNTVGIVGLATVMLLVLCVITVDFGKLTSKGEPPPVVVSPQKIEK